LLYSSPIVALFPLMVLILRLGHKTVVVITILTAIVPIMVNASQAVGNVDRNLIQAARSLGAGEADLLRKVMMPASVPTIAAGLRLGMGRALVGMIIGGQKMRFTPPESAFWPCAWSQRSRAGGIGASTAN
jgi:NitT/TauT family transport system permease protein